MTKGKKNAEPSLARGKPKNSTVLDFNPDDRVTFITGFRRRKNERRKVAAKEKEQKAKEDRLVERREIREELKVKREQAREVKQRLQEGIDDNRIFFAGEVKRIDEVFKAEEPPTKEVKRGKKSAKITDQSQQIVDYQVNNQTVSVSTVAIDFSQKDVDDESAYAPIRMQSDDEEEGEGKDPAATREAWTQCSVSIWRENVESWVALTPSVRPSTLPQGSKIRFLTLNVWYSDKWQGLRTRALLEMLHQEQVDIVCLQEVGDYARQELLLDEWVRHYYCVVDANGDCTLEERNFGPFILMRSTLSASLCDARLIDFARSITGRCAVALYLQGLTIINVHLEGLNNERVRLDQLKQLLPSVEQEGNVILLGDFGALPNEVPKHTQLLQEADLDDIWEELHGDAETNTSNPGWTFDQLAIQEMLPGKQRKKKNKTQARFSRVFLKSECQDWRASGIEVQQHQQIQKCKERVLTSVHYGLIASVSNGRSYLMRPAESYSSDEDEESPPRKRQKNDK